MTNDDKAKVKEYLDSVKRHTANRAPSEQAELCLQLEEHIHETIRAMPDSDVSEVIAAMDPPEYFSEPDESQEGPPAVLGQLTLGKLALVVLIIGVATPFVLMALSVLIRGHVGSIINVGLPFGVLMVIVALGMGIGSRREPVGKATLIASATILALLSLTIPVNRAFSSRPGPQESMGVTEYGDEGSAPE